MLTALLDSLPPPATCYAIFFAVSFGFLVLLASTGLPAVLRATRRHLRLTAARYRRSGRMLADRDKLDSDSRLLEGIYRFEQSGEWASYESGEAREPVSDAA